MSDIKQAIAEPNGSKTSETKLTKAIRRVSKLPKCATRVSINQKVQHAEGDQLDFTTRMKMKNKISELQQLNNELRFKLTTAESKLRAKDGELIAADSLNKQLKNLLDKHINREHELNSQILNLEKKIAKVNSQLNDIEEERQRCLSGKNEIENLKSITEELKGNLVVKEAHILNLSEQITEVKQSLNTTSVKNTFLESKFDEMKKVLPMLEIRKNYINILEEKVRHLENLYSSMNEENCKLKYGIDRLENFRFCSFLSSMENHTNLLQY